METMIYLCRAERQGRMIAVAIRPESLYKNECPIEGHPFLPNDKPGILPIHLVGKCERKQGATEKVSYVSVWIENKCSPFQYDFKKLSIVPANETKKRLLKSGKDKYIYMCATSVLYIFQFSQVKPISIPLVKGESSCET